MADRRSIGASAKLVTAGWSPLIMHVSFESQS
jgi:hypothetical protein